MVTLAHEDTESPVVEDSPGRQTGFDGELVELGLDQFDVSLVDDAGFVPLHPVCHSRQLDFGRQQSHLLWQLASLFVAGPHQQRFSFTLLAAILSRNAQSLHCLAASPTHHCALRPVLQHFPSPIHHLLLILFTLFSFSESWYI